jgi:hypothetical protein
MQIPVPSVRNLEVFHRVHTDDRSLREVGREFNLSHNRVAEICEQVERWRKYVAPDWEESRNRRQDSVALCKFHKERSGRGYQILMDAWRHSGERRTECGAVTTTVKTPGDPKYLLQALRCSREQVNAALVLAKLPDEFFLPPENIEVVEMTPQQIAREEEEEADRLVMEAEREAMVARKTKEFEMLAKLLREEEEEDDDEDEDEDEEDVEDEQEEDEPPVSVLTVPPAENAACAAPPAATASATSASDKGLDVAEIVRQQSRHDRRKKIAPVQPTAANEEKRRALAEKLFGA